MNPFMMLQSWHHDTPEKYIDPLLVTEYSYTMNKADKLIEKLRNSPNGIGFTDFEAALARLGWKFDRQSGSHRLWISPKGARLPLQANGPKAKGYQVKQFLKIYDQEEKI